MTLEFWRDLSVVWLALFCVIGMTLPLALAAFAVKGMHQLVARAPGWLGYARRAAADARRMSEKGSRRVVAPIITANRTAARLGTVVQRLSGRRTNYPKGT